MTNDNERILLVESNAEISDLIARQALKPLGYQVRVVTDASQAIQQVIKFTPDLVISNLNLPDLSGKDLMVALSSQGAQMPLIVIVEKGQETDIIQAFRLGAADYLLWPAREAEVVAAVERSLRQVREDRTRQQLGSKLRDADHELNRRMRELSTLFAVGKAVLTIREQTLLMDKFMEAAMYVAEGDFGWLMLLNESNQAFDLVSQRNLPEFWTKNLGRTLDDGVSSLVALSGETLTINGVALKRFKVANLGQSAVAVPIRIDRKVVGLLVVVRAKNTLFSRDTLALLEALADYASVARVNAHLFRALQETSEAGRSAEKRSQEALNNLQAGLRGRLQPLFYTLEQLTTGKLGPLSAEQKTALDEMRSALDETMKLTNPGSTGKP